LNLAQKLASIRRELTHIEKKGRNEHFNYDYLRAEDIAGEMGDRLAAMNVIVTRRNLSFVQNLVETKDRVDVHVIVTLDYVFIDGDAPTADGLTYDSLVVASIGEGRDSGDKAVPKALTNALKYALTQPLMMRVGDDPEADSEHDKDKGKPVNPPPPDNAADGDSLCTSAQIKKLYETASAKLLPVQGAAWVREQMKAAGVTDKTCKRRNFAVMMNTLLTMKPAARGEESQEPDIGF
jgi:hypothetical protein